MIYKALSVVKPAGDLIRSGLKTIEVRTWSPDQWPVTDLVIIQNERKLGSAGLTEDPQGCAVALVDVVAVRDWTENDLKASCSKEWEQGWLAWELQNVRKIDYPRPLIARLRIYNVEIDDALEGKK